MTGWSVFGISNQFNSTAPLLHEVVASPRPTWVPLLPNCCKTGSTPTMTSGPGTEPAGTLGSPPARGGMVEDRGAPLTKVVTSIGYMVAAIEISPATSASVRGTPQPVRQFLGNQQPSALDAEQARRGIVLIEISFNVEEDKARFPVADHQVKRFIRSDFFDDEPVGRRIQGLRKDRGVPPDQLHRTRLRRAQDTVENNDRKKRIGTRFETHASPVSFPAPPS